MIKRIISISLALVMVLAMAVIPASATGTQYLIDNFETGSVGSVSETTGDGYYASSATSGLFANPTSKVTSNGISLVSGMGYNGTTGLVMEVGPSGGDAFISTKSIDMAFGTGTTNNVVLTYKVKFLSFPTESSEKWACLGHDYKASSYYTVGYAPASLTTGNLFTDKYDKVTATPEKDVWYTVVTKFYHTSEAQRTADITVLDNKNNVVITGSRPAALAMTMSITPIYIKGAAITSGTAKLVVDDFVLYDYVDATQAPSLDSANTELKEGATSVSPSKVHTLVFDQKVKADNTTVKIYKKADSTKTAVSAKVSAVENLVTIAPNASLDKNTEYVLDFSGVKNNADLALAAASAKTISFKTSDLSAPPVLKATSIEDGAVDVAATTKSVTVTFDQPIDTTLSAVKLTYGTNGVIPASISATETQNVYIVSWIDDLGSKTRYTVDLSGVKNSTNPEPAGDSAKFSFTSELLPEYYYIEENFDSYADGTLGSKITGSALFDNTTAKADNTSAVAGAGFGGSTAIKVYSPNSYAPATTKDIELLEGETLFYEFKMNIHSFEAYTETTDATTGETTKAGTSGIYISVGENNSYGGAPIQLKSNLISGTTDQFTYVMYGINDWKSHAFVNDDWYTIVYKATLGDKIYGYVYDKDGKLVCYGRSTNNLTDTTPILFFCGATSNSKGHDILFDDIKAYKVTNEKLASKKDLGDVYAGATGVVPKDKHVIGFNQPIAINTKSTPNATANDIFSLYQGSTKVDATFEQAGGNQIIIKPAKLLAEETTYTVKYEGLASLGGNALTSTSLTFTTMDAAYPVGVVDSSLAISNGTVEAGDFTLTLRNRESELTEGDIVVAFYSDNDLSRLVGLKSFRNESFEEDREVLTLTLDKDYTDVGRIEIIMYDSISSFIPIMSPYVVD